MSTDETVAAQLAALHAKAASGPAADTVATLDEERARHARRGVPDDVAAPGATMPGGDLLDANGEPTTLEDARAGRPALVVFYRGAWCPYCNLTLRAYESQLVPALDERDVPLIAISPQTPDGSLTMQESNALTYTVLSDPGNRVARALGILAPETSEDARTAAAGLGVDVAGSNADGTDTVPMPTAVIVDADGVIRWIDVHPDYATRSEPKQILDALAEVSGRAAER